MMHVKKNCVFFLFVAYVCQAFSVLTFQLLLILLGKGYTITRGQISRTGSIKIAVFMTVYVFVYAGMFLWETEVSVNHSSTSLFEGREWHLV